MKCPQFLLAQLGADPLQLAEFPDRVHLLVVEPPESPYPVLQEYVQLEPSSLEFEHDTLPCEGEESPGQRITVLRNVKDCIETQYYRYSLRN